MTISWVEAGVTIESGTDLTPFIKAIRKYLLKITVVTLVATGIPIPLVSKMIAKYVATATVLIKAQADHATPIESIDSYDSTRAPYYETQYNLMQSGVVLARAVKDMRLDENPEFNGDEQDSAGHWTLPERTRVNHALTMLRRHLTFTIVRQTQLVYISYESVSATESAAIANGVAHAFINYSIDQKIKKTEQARSWNTQQLQAIRQQVTAKKQEMAKYLAHEGLLTFHGIDGFETEKLGIITTKLADAKERRLAAQADDETMRLLADSPIESLASLPQISNHTQMKDLRVALIEAKRHLYELRHRYGPKHHKILEAQAQIDAIHAQSIVLFNELKDGITKTYQAAVINEQRYQALLNQQMAAFKTLVAKRDHYNALKTDLEKTEELYKALFLRSKEQGLAAQYREPNTVLYDPALVPEQPKKLNKKFLIAMVSVMTLVISVLSVIIMTALNRRIADTAQLQARLGLVPIGDIPIFITPARRSKANYLQDHWVEAVSRNPYAADIIHGINTAIQFHHAQTQVIGVASCFKEEGASSVVRLLARSIAKTKRTLILDLDYRHPTPLQELAPPADHPGGFAALASGASLDALVTLVDVNLDVLGRGKLTDSPLVFFHSEAFRNAMNMLMTHYAQLVINMPVIETSKDSQLILQLLDTLVIVVKANQHTSPELMEALAKLPLESHQTVLGVLNQVKDDDLQSEESRMFIAQSSSAELNAVEYA